MKKEQLKQMKDGKGFIAALDQSGGSTPKALKTPTGFVRSGCFLIVLYLTK